MFLNHHIEGDVIRGALLKASSKLDLAAVEYIYNYVGDLQYFADAFDQSLTNKEWHRHEHLELYQLLVGTGFFSEAMADAIADAAYEQNLALVETLAESTDDPEIFTNAFIAAYNGAPEWPKTAEHFELLQFLLNKQPGGQCLEQAMLNAALTFDLDTVQLLSEYISEAAVHHSWKHSCKSRSRTVNGSTVGWPSRIWR